MNDLSTCTRQLDRPARRAPARDRFSGFDLADLEQDTAGHLTVFAGASSDMLDDDAAALAAAEIEPGSAAVMIVYENRWAAPFIAAVRRKVRRPKAKILA